MIRKDRKLFREVIYEDYIKTLLEIALKFAKRFFFFSNKSIWCRCVMSSVKMKGQILTIQTSSNQFIIEDLKTGLKFFLSERILDLEKKKKKKKNRANQTKPKQGNNSS